MRSALRRVGAVPAPTRSLRRLALRSLLWTLIPAAALAAAPSANLRVAPATPPAAVATLPPPSGGWSFPQHMTLTYAVDWRVFPAGTAVVHLETDGPLERITVTGDSRGAINLLFRVSDRFQSAFSRTTGCSESFTRQIIEGRRQIDSSQRVEASTHTATYSENNLISHIQQHRSAAIQPCVTDMLSAIYYAGSQPMAPGQSFTLPVLSGVKVTDVAMKSEARETIRTPSGAYPAIRVEAIPDNTTLQKRGSLWIWYSDDGRHIPVQMRARLFWGTLTFRLSSIETN